MKKFAAVLFSLLLVACSGGEDTNETMEDTTTTDVEEVEETTDDSNEEADAQLEEILASFRDSSVEEADLPDPLGLYSRYEDGDLSLDVYRNSNDEFYLMEKGEEEDSYFGPFEGNAEVLFN